MTFDDLMNTFKVQPDLNRQFWTKDNKLNPKIRKALLLIAKTFYEGLDLKDKPKIKDIVFTGSLANYNYSDYSDIDLHLLVDFGREKDVLTQYFLLAKARWNDKHDIQIKGYDVEVYVEDEFTPHTDTAVYSVLRDTWIKEPERTLPVVDTKDVRTKVIYFIGMYKHLVKDFYEGNLKGLTEKIEKFRSKLAKFRQAGLDTGGEYSTENVTFKALRRLGYMEKIKDLQTTVMDKQLSVKETNHG